jgi:hypothetical protein
MTQSFPELMLELGRLIGGSKEAPFEVVKAASKLAERAQELCFFVPNSGAASGAPKLAPGLHPSDLLLELVAAARAADWENVGILVSAPREHDHSPTG